MSGSEDPQAQVAEFLERIVEALGIDGEVEVVDDGETITGTVHADELGLLIGHHGQTIDAVQHLALRMLHGDSPRPSRRVVIDAGDYRERRRATLVGMAEDAADEALNQDRAVSLEAMSAAERRIVHEHLRDRDDVETHSEGDEPERFLVVAPRD
jgi:spoIIIJ-associated protein